MTKDEIRNPVAELNIEIARLVAKFGRWRTLIAIMRAHLRVKSRPPDAAKRDAELRKELGLPEKVADAVTLWRGANSK